MSYESKIKEMTEDIIARCRKRVEAREKRVPNDKPTVTRSLRKRHGLP